MTPTYTVEDPEPVPTGLYEAELKAIIEKTAFFKNDNDEEERRRYYQWQFDIVNDEEFAGRKLFVNVSDAFGPKAKQRQFVESMIGRPLKAGEEFNTDDLIGGVYHVTVHHKTKGDRTYAEVTSINQIRRKKSQKKSEVPAQHEISDQEVEETMPDWDTDKQEAPA